MFVTGAIRADHRIAMGTKGLVPAILRADGPHATICADGPPTMVHIVRTMPALRRDVGPPATDGLLT